MRRNIFTSTFLYFACLVCLRSVPALGQDINYLSSLDSLLNIQISTAAKYEQRINEAPASVSIVTAEEIERYGFRTLDELLTSLRGIYSSYDRAYAYIGLRGFNQPSSYSNKIILLLNGNAVNEGYYGSAPFGADLAFDLDIIERVEVVRGPVSSLYGAGAMLGVVNIITKKAKAIDGVKISAETGSYGNKRTSLIYGKEYDNGLEAVFHFQWRDVDGQDLYYQEYDDAENNFGMVEGLDWDRSYGLLATLNYKNISLLAGRSSREKGIPTGAWEMMFNNPKAGFIDEYDFLELKYKKQLSYNKNFIFRGYFNHYRYEGTYPEIKDDFKDDFDSNEVRGAGGEFQFNWDFAWGNRLVLGTEFKAYPRADYREWDEDNLFFHKNSPYNIFSLYLQDEYQLLKNLALTLGLRHDHYSLTEGSTTPRAAIVYNPAQSSTLKLLFGEAFRSPNPYELYYQSTNEAKNNPFLIPEKIQSEEFIWEQRLNDNLFFTTNFYNFKMEHLINQELDFSDGLLQFHNVGNVRGRGLELELRASLVKGLNGYMNYNQQSIKNLLTKEGLTNSPAHAWKAGVIVPVSKYLNSGIELQYYSQRKTIYGDKTDAFLLTNVNLSSRELLNHLKFSLLIKNIFNTLYATPGGFEHIQHGIYQDRRNFAARIEYKF